MDSRHVSEHNRWAYLKYTLQKMDPISRMCVEKKVELYDLNGKLIFTHDSGLKYAKESKHIIFYWCKKGSLGKKCTWFYLFN